MIDQPTVLLDKNGRHLREGDLLRTRTVSGRDVTGVAVWVDGCWWIHDGGAETPLFDISGSEIVDK